MLSISWDNFRYYDRIHLRELLYQKKYINKKMFLGNSRKFYTLYLNPWGIPRISFVDFFQLFTTSPGMEIDRGYPDPKLLSRAETFACQKEKREIFDKNFRVWRF